MKKKQPEFTVGFIPNGSGEIFVSSIPPKLGLDEVRKRAEELNADLKQGTYVVLVRRVTPWRIVKDTTKVVDGGPPAHTQKSVGVGGG